MIPTPELVEQLRNLAGEKEEGRFTDAELKTLLRRQITFMRRLPMYGH